MKKMTSITERKFGAGTTRQVFGKTHKSLEPTDLLKIQRDAFKKFLKEGIDNAFKDVFPIISPKGNIRVEFISKRIEKPKNEYQSIVEAKQKGKNYLAKLFAKVRIINDETGIVKKDEILFCEMPLMTNGCSFIINGSEKVIISQLERSPSVYFELNTPKGDDLFHQATIIPNLGPRIQLKSKVRKFNTTANGKERIDSIKIYLDTVSSRGKRAKSFLLTTFLRSLGLKEETIIELFGGNTLELMETLKREKTEIKTEDGSLKHIYRSIRSGDRATSQFVADFYGNLFFNKKRYKLTKTGRAMLNRKLNLVERLVDTYLAEDLKTAEAGVVRFKKDTYITFELAKEIQAAYENKELSLSKISDIKPEVYGKQLEETKKLKHFRSAIIVKVYKNPSEKDVVHTIIANDPTTKFEFLTVPDLIATISYYINILNGIGLEDDTDSLKNKRIKLVGELLENQLRIGLAKMESSVKEKMATKEVDKITPKFIINNKHVANSINSFFNTSQLSQFMDQINPLAEMSNKRRVTSLGPAGLKRETAPFETRDVHQTHYGRICPIETPEGQNIGLILNFALFSRINELGFIETPYFKVENGVVDYSEPVYLSAIDEENKLIAQSSTEIENGKITAKVIVARKNGDFLLVSPNEIQYLDVASNQLASVASSLIPFLENDDANRTLMGANMQRQAVPLIKAEAPVVATGMEEIIGKYAPTNIRSERDGVVSSVDSTQIIIKDDSGRSKTYRLRTFERSNQASLITQKPIVNIGDEIKEGQLLTDSSSFDNGELAIGKNVLVAFSTWNGYNYEDAIIVSERLVKDDVYTSIHIEEYKIEFRRNKVGNDELTTEIPNVSNYSKRFLDANGIVRIGSEVSAGDILVGRTTPKGEENLTPEEKLLSAIFSEKSKANKDTSLKVKHGQAGTVIDAEILSRENGDKLDDGIEQIVKIYIAQKRKIKVGDKMAGRHGNKGVISRVLPIEDMPHLEDGTPVDIMLNPLGVPSRMNIGQVLELHLGMAARGLNTKFVTPILDGAKVDEINEKMKEAGLPESGKLKLYNPISGDVFDNDVAIGVMYMLKLSHMVDDKVHARSVGPYSIITQQPLGGKSQNGGQRFGEMEVWAIEAYGAANVLREMLTYKSDDISGRNNLYNAITTNKKIPVPGIPESFNVLANELRGLSLKPELLQDEEEFENE
ncbi:MAG: DNA-directed RNA polymerase subunit beta [Mycoplasma sp.]|nr:DNA-directed RNA polymerase subunit beta [Mycoplasma sp.]